MKIRISKSRTTSRITIQKAFRDRSGKSTTKDVMNLGTLEEIKEKHGCADPVAWAKEYARQLTLEDKEKRKAVTVRLMPEKLIPKNERQGCLGGYLFLQRLYYKLGLDRICEAILRKRKFDFDLDSALQLMVYGRIIDPRSKLATHKQADAMIEPLKVDLQHLYRSLDIISENSDYIQKRLYHNSLSAVRRDTTVLYYDCTNYFFEVEKPDPAVIDEKTGKTTTGLRQYGVSKEHRPNPIVQMGLFIDNTGLPLAMCINHGNTNEQTTLIPTEKLIVEGMGVENIVVCTDGGLSSEDNRSYNSTAQRSFITVQSLKKLPEYLQEWALETKGWKLTPLSQAKYYGDRIFYRERWIVNENTKFSQRLIVTFSYKYRDYLRVLRNREIDKAAVMAKNGCSGKRKNKSAERFLQERQLQESYATEDGELAVYRTVALNLDAIKDEERYDGFYGICTDLNDSVDDVLNLNHNRWESEDAFRVLKTDFRARPAFVWTDAHIKGHFLVCFIALLIFRIIENELGYRYTSSEILDAIRDFRFLIEKGEGYRPNFTRTDLTDDLHKCAGFRLDTELVTSQKLRQIRKFIKEC